MLFNLTNNLSFKQMLLDIEEFPEVIIKTYNRIMFNKFRNKSYSCMKSIIKLSFIDCSNRTTHNTIFNIGVIKNLKELALSAKLYKIPECIPKLSGLHTLDLNNNMLTKISKEIYKLPNLESLHLCNNKLISISSKIYTLTKLKKLYLSNNKLIAVPRNIDKLHNLTILFADNNQISSIPPSFYKAISLKCINLSNNKISYMARLSLPKLKYLDLSSNIINYINMYSCTALIELDLSNNNISRISEDIDSFINLKYLDLSDNYLSDLPKQICDLTNLTTLILHHNALLELPENLGDFISILKIDVSHNALQELPLSILNLHNVDIDIRHNDEIDLDYRIATFLYGVDPAMIDEPDDNIYNNSENVHASSIHASIKQSISSLIIDDIICTRDELYQSIVNTKYFSVDVLSEIYSNIIGEEILASLSVSYFDVLRIVWKRITSDELRKRLSEEIIDGKMLCFVGKISRLVNSLSGFYPDINVSISDNEAAGCITQRIINGREINDEVITEIIMELTARNFSDVVIHNWTSNIA